MTQLGNPPFCVTGISGNWDCRSTLLELCRPGFAGGPSLSLSDVDDDLCIHSHDWAAAAAVLRKHFPDAAHSRPAVFHGLFAVEGTATF